MLPIINGPLKKTIERMPRESVIRDIGDGDKCLYGQLGRKIGGKLKYQGEPITYWRREQSSANRIRRTVKKSNARVD